jgi:hypothetical protein
MGSNVPNTINDAIAWYEDRIDAWQTSAAQIGLAAGTVTSLKALITAARAKFADAEKARITSEAATLELKNAAATLRVVGSGAISTIKGYAATTNNPNVYAIAQVSPPSPPSPLPPPNAPTDVMAELLLNGALKLKWKATQPGSGTVYRIARQFNGAGEFINIDTVGEKTFTDNSVPYGTDAVTYRISARRGGVNSPSQTTLNLQFGSVAGNGQQSVTFTSETAKLAA